MERKVEKCFCCGITQVESIILQLKNDKTFANIADDDEKAEDEKDNDETTEWANDMQIDGRQLRLTSTVSIHTYVRFPGRVFPPTACIKV